MAIIRRGVVRRRRKFAVCLVDENDVRQFHDAAFHSLQVITTGRKQHQQKQIRHIGDGGFRLTDTHGFHQYVVISGRLTEHDALTGSTRHTAEGKSGRGKAVYRRAGHGPGVPCGFYRPGSNRRKDSMSDRR